MFSTGHKPRSSTTSARRRSYNSNRPTKSREEGDFDDMGRNGQAWSYWGMRKKKRGQF